MAQQNNNALTTGSDAERGVAIKQALMNSLYPGAAEASVDMVLSYCRAGGYDPMTKPVHIVGMSVKKPGTRNEYEWRDVVMPGIELYRIKAHRTGELAGYGETKFGSTVTRKVGNIEVTFPEWCEVTVMRHHKGQPSPVAYTSGRVYWEESYATKSREDFSPNAMWMKRRFGQLEKCAEALALRRGFPEIGAQPTAEEMEGKFIDGEFSVVEGTPPKAIEPPKSKSESQPQPQPKSQRPEAQPAKKPDQAAQDQPKTETKPDAAVGDGSQQAGPPITEGQERLLLARLESKGYEWADLKVAFPNLCASDFGRAKDWIADQPPKGA